LNFKLSPSSLNLLENCPRCFWLKLVKKVSRPRGAFPSLPSGVDGVLKKHFDHYMRLGALPPELKKEGLDCKLFDDEKLLMIWRANFKGITWQDEQSGVLLRGAVDNILEKDGKLIVLDFKTKGFAVKEGDEHYYQDQLNCYNLLLRKNGYQTEDYAYLLYYVPEKILENGDFVFNTKLVKMTVNVEHAENLFRKAVEVLNGEEPKKAEKCEYCGWGNEKVQ